MDKAALGHKIREARKNKGLTQEALAEKAGIGPVYLGEIERGLKMPSLNVFINIVEALEVSADYILRDELQSGKSYVFSELTEKLSELTPKQRKAATAILDAFLVTL